MQKTSATRLGLSDTGPAGPDLREHDRHPEDRPDGVLLVDAELGRVEVQGDRVLHGDHREHHRSPQEESERLASSPVRSHHPADEDAAPDVGEPVEPLDDVVAEGVVHDDEDQDGLVPDDGLEELLEEPGVPPADEEEADHAAHEDQQVCRAQIGAGSADPLDEERPGEDDDCEEDRVGDEDAECEDDGADRQADPLVSDDGGPDHCRHHHDRAPGHQPRREAPSPPRRAEILAHSVEAIEPLGAKWAHGVVGLSLI